jgi:hypothetical protein
MSATKTPRTKKQVLDMKFMIPTLQNILKWTWKKEVDIRGPVQDVLDIIDKRVTGKPLKMQDCFQAILLGCKYKKDKVQLASLQCLLEMVGRSFLKYCKKSLPSVITTISNCKNTNNEDIQFTVLKLCRDIAVKAGFHAHNDNILELVVICSYLAIKSRHGDLRKIAYDFMLKIHTRTYELVQTTDEAAGAVGSDAVYPSVFHILKFQPELSFASHHTDALLIFEKISDMAKKKGDCHRCFEIAQGSI